MLSFFYSTLFSKRNWKFLLFLEVFFISFFYSFALADGALPSGWDRNLTQISEFSAPPEGQDGVEIFDNLIRGNIIPIFKYVFIGIGFLFFLLYVYMLLFNLGEDDRITNQKKNILYAFVGFSLMGIAPDISQIFDPMRAENSGLGDVSALDSTVDQVILFVKYLLGVIALLVSTYSGFLLITAGGDEDQSTRGKMYFVYAFVGFLIVMLADPLVNTVFFPERGMSGVGDEQISNFATEFIGVLLFILQIVGGLIFILFLISGFLFLTARDDEDQQGKAKRILLWSILGVVLILIAYPLIQFFVPS